MIKALSSRPATHSPEPDFGRAVHLLDARGTPDPTLDAVDPGNEGKCLVLGLKNPLDRWRARRSVAMSEARTVVVWGESALEAVRTLSRRRIYRPLPHLRMPPRPASGVEVFAATPFQQAQFAQAGWAGETISVLFPPADPVERNTAARPGDREDVLWWLSADTQGSSGWREAVWAITLLHITTLRERRHRILLTGDGQNLVRARRFIVQLGLPELALMAAGASAEEGVAVADAALFLPEGPSDPRPALLARAAGLPIVHNGRFGLDELLANHYPAVLCTGRRPREIVKAMLQLIRGGLERAGVDRRWGTSACRARWHRLLGGGERG